MALRVDAYLGLNGTAFEQGLTRAGAAMHRFSSGALSSVAGRLAGLFSIGAMAVALHKVVGKAKELVNEAKRMGVAPEQVQLLTQAAKDASVEIDKVAGAFEKLNIARDKALHGDKGAMAAFAQFGISSKDLGSQNAASLSMGKISEGVKSKSVQELTTSMREIFGKGFGALIPFLKTDFDELGRSMKSVGAIMDTETAVKLKKIGDELELLGSILVVSLAPAILNVTESLISGMESYLRFIDEKLGRIPTPTEQSSGFFGKAGHGVAGVATGLLALGNLVGEQLGIKTSNPQSADGENGSETRIRQTTEHFAKSFGFMSGGIMNSVAEKIAKTSEPLSKSFAEKFKELRDKLAAEAAGLNNPAIPPGQDLEMPEKASKRHSIYSDSLLAVGNFLGSARGGVASVADKHYKEALRHTRQFDQIINKLSSPASGTTFPANP